MIDLTTETLITMRQAAAMLPERPHLSTLHRWRIRGIHGARLETLLLGGRRYTSREAMQRFAAAITAAADGQALESAPPTLRAREAGIRRAEEELERTGI